MSPDSRLPAALLFVFAACGGVPPEAPPDPAPGLRDALTLHASFDDGMDAAYARGDRRIYSAPSYKELDEKSPGHWGDQIEIVYDSGHVGHALRFVSKNVKALFYTADQNVAFSTEGWTGTVSFWLSLDPAQDLEPGFCDPIQITDSAYNDSAIWVDFTKENPRQFRLGVFGDLAAWNPEKQSTAENPKFNDRLVVVDEPPFASGEWTHVAIVHEELGAPQGRARLYLNGELQGESSRIDEAFSWNPVYATIRLGVNYVGLFDELAVFDRALTPDEIHTIYSLEGGISALAR